VKVSIGQLLRDRRGALGLRRAEVAEQAHVPEEELAAFEEGRGNITAAAVDRLAYVLAVDPFALREGRIEKRPNASIFFFQRATFPDFRDVEDRPKVMDAFERALALIDVDALLGRPSSLRLDFPAEGPTPEAAKDGYRLANRVRAALEREIAPMPDMALLLEERFDILVRAESLASTSISALTVKDNVRGAAAVILNVNNERRANPSTARVDLAHELSHVLFDPADGDVNLVIDEERDDDRSQREREGSAAKELSEKRARVRSGAAHARGGAAGAARQAAVRDVTGGGHGPHRARPEPVRDADRDRGKPPGQPGVRGALASPTSDRLGATA
jgi:transcriptional regulator with XRE-family HTH domain